MPPDRPATIAFALSGRIAREDLPRICARLRLALARSGARTAVCDVSAIEAEAEAIDTLARLELTARRLGVRILLRHPSDQLRALLAFAGLEEALCLEPRRQVEEGEDRLGVEEEGELGDPAA